MKKTFLLSGITALITVGSVLCAAEPPPPPNEGNNPPPNERMQAFQDRGPQFGRQDGKQNRQGCPAMMMKCGNAPCPGDMMKRQGPFAMNQGKKQFGCFGLMPRAPMNEDEMAKFADLGQAVREALENYREDASEKNTAQLRTSLENLVTASQQYEIERCEKALARAKAAVAKKDQIVDREMKKMTRKHNPAEKHFGNVPGPLPPPEPVPAK